MRRTGEVGLAPRYLKMAAVAAFTLAAVCGIYAWGKHDDEARVAEYVSATRTDKPAEAPVDPDELVPAMANERRNALWLAVGLVACGIACLRIASRHED